MTPHYLNGNALCGSVSDLHQFSVEALQYYRNRGTKAAVAELPGDALWSVMI